MLRRNWLKTLGVALPVAAIAFASFATVGFAQDKGDHKAGEHKKDEGKKDEGKKDAKKDIVATAMANKDFSTLCDLLKKAELVETLQGPGPFTVFAPTNEAFEKLGKDKLEALGKDKAKLAATLKYHVVNGKMMSKEIKAGKSKTLEGTEITIEVKDGKVMVNGAKVTKADIEASNGIIHVIDTVIMPAEKH